jgi:hypothetical protein
MATVMKTKLFCAIVGLAFAGLSAVAQERSETPKPGVLFTGASLPAPPQQGKPWKPPASRLPEKWISAAEELYRSGFADPRGCEYREVKLAHSSSLWGRCDLFKTHAWVIPETPAEKPGSQRFAVTWDGQVYPVVRLGSGKDLAVDVKAIIKKSEREAATPRFPGIGDDGVEEFPYSYDRPWKMRAWKERQLISYDSLFALKCCVLLRLGEVDLGERLWSAWKARDGRVLKEGPTGEDPYMVFAWEWGWALFDRALGAHLRGDDVVALESAKLLVSFADTVPRTAAQRGFHQLRNYGSGDLIPFLPLRDPPSRLLEESARRLKGGPVRRVRDAGPEKFPDRSQRIAALVSDLEDISAGPEYELGGWPLSSPFIHWGGGSVVIVRSHPPVNPLKASPIVQALISEGGPAVEPLLKCLLNDRRLTRVAGTTPATCGDFLSPRDFVGVDVAAYVALCGILKADVFGPLTEHGFYHGCDPNVRGARLPATSNWNTRDVTGDPSMELRQAVAEEIRHYWERTKEQRPEEAWLAVLADADLTCKVWLEAAEKIVAPAGKTAAKEPLLKTAEEIDVTTVDGRSMAGEALREKKNPSLSELLVQRCDDSARLAKLRRPDGFEWDLVGKLALCLARWDPKAAIPVLNRRIAEWRHAFSGERTGGEAESFVALVEAALQASDDKAALQYAAWLRATPPGSFSFFEPSIFMPVWRHPDNPKLAELVRWLFLADDSPWHPIHELKPLSSYEMIHSPLVGVPAFREMLKREFNNIAPIGQFEVKQGSLSMVVMNTSMGSGSEYAPDVELPKAGSPQPLRACDFYAVEISRLEGSPRYELYWPENRRDAVRKDMAKFLDQWGNCFRDRSNSFESRYDHFSTARFRLSRLSQPATAEDVAAGRAIFSLHDRIDHQVRIVGRTPYPSMARWKTLKQFPLLLPQPSEHPKSNKPEDLEKAKHAPWESFDREGYVWQAEEVLIDGVWRRYYGFVGNHVIAKVPAEEIELIDRFSPAHPHRW